MHIGGCHDKTTSSHYISIVRDNDVALKLTQTDELQIAKRKSVAYGDTRNPFSQKGMADNSCCKRKLLLIIHSFS